MKQFVFVFAILCGCQTLEYRAPRAWELTSPKKRRVSFTHIRRLQITVLLCLMVRMQYNFL